MAFYSAKITPYHIVFEVSGESFITFYDTKEEMFYAASKLYAFDDIYIDTDIAHMSCEGEDCHYAGWKPGMRLVFKTSTNKVVWDQAYPEWDH